MLLQTNELKRHAYIAILTSKTYALKQNLSEEIRKATTYSSKVKFTKTTLQFLATMHQYNI